MKKILNSLPFKLLIAVLVGSIIGLISNETIMNIMVTIKYVLGQIITYCVPLIIIGFIAPSITKLGKNASKVLFFALIIAYVSTIGAAFMSAFAGYNIIPHLSIVSDVDKIRELPKVVFELKIPPIMEVMTALVSSILIGLAVTWTKATRIANFLDEFQKVVLSIVSRVIIPILPFFIASTFAGLAYEGTLTRQLPVFLNVIVIVM